MDIQRLDVINEGGDMKQNNIFIEEHHEPSFSRPVCQLLTFRQFLDPNFKKWACEIGWQFGFNRKLWEYAFILNALDLDGKLGGRGLGFGVGQEPTVPVMLRHGAQLLASDLADEEAQARGWLEMKFDVDAAGALTFRYINMNEIPGDLRNYDFLWSCGSLEHIGGLELGLKFIENAMACLKPGGIAVHTTEFTLTSNEETYESPALSFYREKDIRGLAERLRSAGCELEMNLTRGQHQLDQLVLEEYPPWELSLKEQLCGHTITSLGLVIHKPE